MSGSRDILVASFTADDKLDDIGRARLWARLEDRIAEPVVQRRSWRPFALVAAGACIALLVVVFARTPGRDTGRTLVAPANATLTTPLGPHARAALVGPAQLSIAGDAGDATTVKLERGTLLADFAGGPGRSLEVIAPGMRAMIVGTLFSVEVRAAATCVAVAHGRVQVTIGARVAFVATGEQLCTTDLAPAPIEPRVRDALARHERILAETTGSSEATTTAPTEPTPPTAPRDVVASKEPTPAPTEPAPPTTRAQAAPTPPRAVAAMPAQPTPAPTRRPRDVARAPTQPTPAPTRRPSTTTPRDVAPAQPTRAPTTSTAPPHDVAPAQPTPQPTPTTTPRDVAAAQPTPATPGDAARAPVQPPFGSPPPQVAQQPKPAATAPTPPTAQELYRSAETALAHRDPAAADKALAQLVASAPTSSLVPQALYDRARIAYDRKDYGTAKRHLDALATAKDSPLVESGRYLACRIAVEARDGSAEKCLRQFRASYPRSPHDRDVLGTLAQLVHASGGCAAARPYIDELQRDYPHSTLAAGWRDTCSGAK